MRKKIIDNKLRRIMRPIINFKGIKPLTIMLLLLCGLSVKAKQIPTVTGILKSDFVASSPILIGTPSAVNTILVPVVAGTTDYDIRNTISLKYDLSTDTFFLAKADVRVKVSIARWDAAGSSMTTVSRKLSISVNNKFSSPLLEQSSVNLVNGYKITMTVDSIWVNGVPVHTLPRYVSVESEINMDRYYDFSSSSNTASSPNALTALDDDCDGINDEVKISWSIPSAVPEEYQLEWTYVNSYSSTGTAYPASSFNTDFRNNSTRITTYDNSYKVSLLFDKGYIAFRVRAVGRDISNPSLFIYGPWSQPDIVNMGSLGSNEIFAITQEHEKIKNWQYATTYAEEGKKKEVISYFDGSLHNRQTVTKINSDNNVIVGETIYDYQGRPAVNILPVPVVNSCVTTGSEPAIKYYNKFNVDDTNKVYSKNDFDTDALGNCISGTAPMDTISGASRYYSNNNADQSAQQSYVPHAKKYPFTQIEYTPDNTGRIRNQSGVGIDYQLSSGKETKYLYGQPNQIQVDRLFGSETGDASHYKKNVVIDANGQTSVAYMNQEGQTIATALAGIPPVVGAGPNTRLDSLAYAGQNQNLLTIDLFNKNAAGTSTLNTVPASNDQLDFSTQLLVTFTSLYEFKYDLTVDTLGDPCLRNNVCINCVYDMEIQIKDECGVDLVTSVSPFLPIKRVTGKVDTTGNKLTFNINCTSPHLYKDSAKVNLVLQPGVYTVSKILKINQEAKDFYVKNYLDSVNNSCVKTLKQFQAAELAKIDTMDCYNTCASCAAALGQKDDFVSAGKGTAAQWDFLMDQCLEPCRQKTLCQVTYEMMQSDVSPGGQYAQFNATTFDASNEPLSVLNTGNQLSPNIIPGQSAHWKVPLMKVNSNFYNYYLDENGNRTRVNLTQSGPGVYQPPVDNALLVYNDPATGVDYTYPENLQKLEDFIQVWNPGFAKSLVVFHPEYAYYVSCSEQAVTFPGDNRSSDNFDSLLLASNSFAQALAAGFILPTYSTPIPALSKIKDMWLTASGNYDPFFTNNTFQYTTGANLITNTKTNINMGGGAGYNVNLQTQMDYIINHYQFIGTTPYTMADVAAALTRCGNNFATPPTAACMAFGTNFYPFTTPLNDSIKDAEWRMFRQFYFSEKQKLQYKRMDFFAKHGDGFNSNYFGGCNACIGTTSYNPFTSGMVILSPGPVLYPVSAFFDLSQPCGYAGNSNYSSVTKRFYDPANTGLNTGSVSQQIYQNTGQCPLAFQLQNFLNSMAVTSKLTSPTNVNLNTVNEFNPDLYHAVNGGVTVPFISYQWDLISATGSVLTAHIVDPSTNTNSCTVTLDKTGTSITNFSDITGISQLAYDPTGSGPGAFKALAVYSTGSSTATAIIKGNSCIDVQNCSFAPQCTPNQFASEIGNLTSYLKAIGALTSTAVTPVSTDPTLVNFLTPTIKNMLGSPNTNVKYQFVAPGKCTFYDAANPSTKIVLTITGIVPSGATPSIMSFANIRSNYNNLFKMDGMDVNGFKIADVDAKAERITATQTVGISMGSCSLPDPPECAETEHLIRHDLELLVNEVLTTKPFNTNVNLYSLADYSSLLKSYVPTTVSSTGSTYTSGVTASPNFDTLKINVYTTAGTPTATCTFKLYHYRNNGTIHNFADITNVSHLTGIGSPDIAGNYTFFKALATYNIASVISTDTIYGVSCWNIKNCEPCPVSPVTNTLERMANAYVAQGKATVDPSLKAYASYKQSLADLNKKMDWKKGENTYLTPLSYLTFADKGYIYAKPYLNFVSNFDPLLDEPTMLNVDSFIINYGNSVNCDKEYARYVKALNVYGASVNKKQKIVLNPIGKKDFTTNRLCAVSFKYISYLKEQAKTNNSASSKPNDILGYFKLSEKPENDYADSCELLYEAYVSAHSKFMENTTALKNCNKKGIVHPLYSYDEIVELNLCCSKKGLLVFHNYINSLVHAKDTCPPALVAPENCSDSLSCEDLYNQYLTVHAQFISNSTLKNACDKAKIDHPLYTYDDIVKFNFCCSQKGLTAFSNYISSLAVATNTCPPALVPLNDCSDSVTCQDLYNQYLTVHAQFLSNTTLMDACDNAGINHPLYKYEDIIKYNFCCSKKGLTAFSNYINSLANATTICPPKLVPLEDCSDSVTCEGLYDQYLTVYAQFQANATVQENCGSSGIEHPLYTYEQIQNANLCCSPNGIAAFTAYINSLSAATSTCPPGLAGVESCDTYTDPDDCQQQYINFIAKINAFNASLYSTAFSYTLDPNIYPTYYSFVHAGYCECVHGYNDYLSAYLTIPANTSLPLPVNIDHYDGCLHIIPIEGDSCNARYGSYISAVNAYNNFVESHPALGYPYITTTFTIEEFKQYCICAPKFIANLHGIVKGDLQPSVDDLTPYLDLPSACEKPCTNGPQDSSFIFPPYVKYDNPCVRQKINLAMQNGANAFQQYIDSMTTAFATKYTKHCLSALENFTTRYVDKEYHFTLYYYDQAGNLVRTVPPEGVEFIPVTSFNDALEQKIISDRTYNQQTVFTTHRMPTTYVYNSLNQLISQSIPDHDLMDICDGKYPNGLDTSFVSFGLQFVTPTKGYLCGGMKNTSGGYRGIVYTSTDGGNYWSRVDGITSGDLQKVQFTSSTDGFAVSTFGMVFHTVDGGNTWDLLTGLYKPLAGTRYVDRLTDLYFRTGMGLVGGNMNSTSPIFYTTDNGITFTPATVAGAVAGDTITGFTYDGTIYVACVRNGNIGKLFTSTTGTAWTQVTNFAANNLKKVQYIDNSRAYAIGDEGTLLKLAQTISVGNPPIWQLVPTGMLGDFRDIYFKNATDGVAIIDSVPGKGKIYKTFNGGVNWQELSDPGDYYNSLQLYDASQHRLMAAGAKGLLAKVLMNNLPFGMTKLATPATTNNSFADAILYTGDGTIRTIAVSDASPIIQMTNDVQTAGTFWQSLDATAAIPSIPSGDAQFKKVLMLDSVPANPYLKGILLGTNGTMYSYYKQPYISSLVCRPVTVPGGFSGKFFSDITSNVHTFTSPIYALDSMNKNVYVINFAGTVASATLLNNASSITKRSVSIDIQNGSNEFMMVGDSGHIEYTTDITANPIVWNERTLKTRPVAITKVRTITGGDFIAGGIDGALWKSNGGSSTWQLKRSGTIETLTSMAVDNTGAGLIAATNGQLYRLTNAQTQAPVLVPLVTSVLADLTDVAIEPSGTSAYATAKDGQVLYMSNYNSNSVFFAAQVSPYPVNGVAYKNGSNAMVVGNNVLATSYFSTGAFVTTQLFTPVLRSIHFYDANNGLVIDSNNVIRKTTDGGLSWSVVLPQVGSPGLVKTFATAANKGLLVGYNKYAAVINNNVVTALSVPTGFPVNTNFFDINFNSTNTYGIIVGAKTHAGKIEPLGSSYVITYLGQATTAAATNFRAVHVFDNKTFIASGSKGCIYYYKGGTFTQQMAYVTPAGQPQSSVVLKDIYFKDDYNGYVVGSIGCAFKVNLQDSIGTIGTTAGSMPWQPLCSDALYGIYSGTASQVRKLDFNTVALSGQSQLMIAGADSNVTVAGFAPNRYARLFKEQFGKYSSLFWYDKLGRLILSQNTKQFNKKNPNNILVKQAFSYTLYDALGRIIEVGEKYENYTTGSPKFNSIFGSLVNGYYNNNTIDDTRFLAWINGSGSKRDVTKTYYDSQSILPLTYTQENLRKRVASTTFEDIYDGNDLTYKHGTHYTYDIHGNVNTLWQENTQVGVTGQEIKQTDYEYDLISGKVNRVIYSPGKADQFIHRYTYDADNRVTKVETSTNDIHYDIDAKYFYYAHGPLARTEYGKDHVQGMDYAYTLQGWIKGVNSNTLKTNHDMGHDGDNTVGNPNGMFARDIMGYTLNYYKGDYEAVNFVKWNNAASRFEAYNNSSDLFNSRNDLYNGNISAMVTTISEPVRVGGNAADAIALPLGTGYIYDQLNRLKTSRAFTNISLTGNAWTGNGSTAAKLYRNTFTYDANGNINTQMKYDSTGVVMDSLVYHYETTLSGKVLRNRLYNVNDLATYITGYGDITNQGAFSPGSGVINTLNNYSFDEIGNLVRDSKEEIDTINWNVYGKIKYIIRSSGSSKDNMYFDYDASGNRVAKHLYTSAGVWKHSLYYQRDAQGNVMSVYDKKTVSSSLSYKLDEQHLYGSSRLGMVHANLEMIGAPAVPDTTKSYLGLKNYELGNHLGNVLSVISDKKLQVAQTANPTLVDHYVSDQNFTADYYPFGQIMPGRTFGIPSCETQTLTNTTYTAYTEAFAAGTGGFSPIGKGSALSNVGGTLNGHDPLTLSIPGGPPAYVTGWGMQKNYAVLANTSYTLTLDVTVNTGTCPGDAVTCYIMDGTTVIASLLVTSSGTIQLPFFTASATAITVKVLKTSSSVCDFAIDNLYLSYQDLQTQVMCDAITTPLNDYRYGFNGKEKDDEVKGAGNSVDYGMRMYDPRIGRMLSIDPKFAKLPSYSPYSFSLNCPTYLVDHDGQLPWPIHVRSFISTGSTGGGLFYADGRGPSVSTATEGKERVTSRVRTSFVADPAKGIITNPVAVSDPTIFYGICGVLPPSIQKGSPTASITNKKSSEGTLSFDFSHAGKDPITPGIVTPELDVHASLTIKENLDKGTLDIKGSFTGDEFPSSEAFIVDQSGKGKVFFGAKKEEGGVTDLYGDNKKDLFNVDMQIQIDKKGNFTGVKQGGKTYSVEDWNKKTQNGFTDSNNAQGGDQSKENKIQDNGHKE